MAESSPNGKRRMGKGENARNKQFLLFPQCFQRLMLLRGKHQGLFGIELSLYHTIPPFNDFEKEVF